MELNYHHLRYFHCVAQEGSIAAAAKRLIMAKATISSQLKSLEAQVGAPLFQRRGRKLELTHIGQHIFQYAEEIFRLGGELELEFTQWYLTAATSVACWHHQCRTKNNLLSIIGSSSGNGKPAGHYHRRR